MIHLRTLGALDLRGPDGHELRTVLAQPKRTALLAYLAATSSTGFQRRDQVLGLFWPELDTEHARAALNRALYYLRRALGDGVLLSRGAEEIGLSGQHIRCDAADFEASAAQGRAREAVELYRGDFLEGFFLSEAPEFERWLEKERARLRQLAYRTAWTLAEEQASAGNHALACHWARWAVERLPYDEAGVQRLVAFLDAMGDRAGAVHTYEQFARRIAEDLELTPAPETQALIEAVRAREHPAPNGSPAALVANGSRVPTPAANEEMHVPARTHRWSKSKVTVTGITAAVALATTVLGILSARHVVLDPKHVVVAHFENRTGDPSLDRIGQMTFEWIRQSLSDTRLVEIVTPPASAPRASHGCESALDLRNLAQDARAGTVICGAIYRENGTLRFHAGVMDALRGAAVWTIPPVSAPLDSAEKAIREVRQRATGAVAVLMMPGYAAWFHQASAPPTFEAFQEFTRPRTTYEPLERAAQSQRAYALDTTFTWAAMSAAAQVMLWNPQKHDSLLKSLVGMRERLPALQVYWLDGMLATRANNRLAAYEAMRDAARLAPSVFLGSQAQAAAFLHRPRESLELLDQVQALAPESKNKNKNKNGSWVIRVEYLHELREYGRELTLVRRAHRDQPNSLPALSAEVRVRAALGQLREVRALIDAALSLPREARYSPGGVMMIAVTEFRAHGHQAGATELLGRAIDWYSARSAAEADSLNTLYVHASALYQAGRWDEAEPLLHKLAAREPRQVPFVLGFLGAIAARRGDQARAKIYLANLDTLSFGSEFQAYDGKFERARIKALLGDAEGALKLLREAVGPQGMDLHTEFDFESLADLPAFKQFTRPKG